VHVLFLEFVIDPACAFVFEADPESDDVMRRPPRPRDESLFSYDMLKRSIGLGACMMIWTVCVYGVALQTFDDPNARALAFVSLVFGNVALIFVSRSRSGSVRTIARRHNNVFWVMATVACIALAHVLYFPANAAVFRFTPPDLEMLLAVAHATVVLVLVAGRWLRFSPKRMSPADAG
jgi:Ca2+-transporting ATPase